MPTAYLALGSNLGDRRAHLAAAVHGLASLPASTLLATSPVYETAPVGPPGQGPYYNLAVALHTTLPPLALLDLALALELARGRQRRERWGPRTLDIDLLLYDDLVLTLPQLTLPHPRLHQRPFVLAPLAQIAPHLTLAGQPLPALLASLDLSGLTLRPDISLQP